MKAAALLVCVGLCACALSQSRIYDQHFRTLANSRDRDLLEKAALALASSNDRAALKQLGASLGDPEFLARLDNLSNPQEDVVHLRRIMLALQAKPSPATEELCLTLAADPDFTALPARMNYLLPALAAVRPMSARSAEVFQRTNAQGYLALNAPLLVANGSPRALEVFETIPSDASVDVESRIHLIRQSILPYRTSAQVLRSVQRMVHRDLPAPVRIALLEAVFERDTNKWFGRIPSPPSPPGWQTASKEARSIAMEIGNKGLLWDDLSPSLRQSIRATLRVSPQPR